MSSTVGQKLDNAVASSQAWFERMETELGGTLTKTFRAPWATEIMDAFSKHGIKGAADITEEKLSQVAATLKTSVEGLKQKMGKCPLGMSIPGLTVPKKAE